MKIQSNSVLEVNSLSESIFSFRLSRRRIEVMKGRPRILTLHLKLSGNSDSDFKKIANSQEGIKFLISRHF